MSSSSSCWGLVGSCHGQDTIHSCWHIHPSGTHLMAYCPSGNRTHFRTSTRQGIITQKDNCFNPPVRRVLPRITGVAVIGWPRGCYALIANHERMHTDIIGAKQSGHIHKRRYSYGLRGVEGQTCSSYLETRYFTSDISVVQALNHM